MNYSTIEAAELAGVTKAQLFTWLHRGVVTLDRHGDENPGGTGNERRVGLRTLRVIARIAVLQRAGVRLEVAAIAAADPSNGILDELKAAIRSAELEHGVVHPIERVT